MCTSNTNTNSFRLVETIKNEKDTMKFFQKYFGKLRKYNNGHDTRSRQMVLLKTQVSRAYAIVLFIIMARHIFIRLKITV